MITLSVLSPVESVKINDEIGFSLQAEGVLDLASINIWINGNIAFTGGLFQTGYTGNLIVLSPSLYSFKFITHPQFAARESVVTIYAEET